MYNPGYANNQFTPGSKSLTDIKPRGSTFTSAGRFISRQEDPIQHNFRFRPDPERVKKEEEALELERLTRFQATANYQTISKASPYAYKSYADNLEKLNNHRDKLDAYTNEIQSAKMRLHNDQQNIINLQKLNRLNADVHKDHIKNQLDKIRSPTHPTQDAAYSPIRPRKRNLSREYNRPYVATGNFDAQLDLLDQFSAGHGLEDQLSTMAKMNRPQPVQVPKRIERTDPLESFLETPQQDPISVQQQYQVNRNSSPTRSMDMQYNPPMNQSPVPYNMNPYYAPPGYGYGYGYESSPMQQENIQLKSYIQRQNELLERLTDKLSKTEPAQESRVATREFDNKLREMEKETNLKLKLMEQQHMIENLQQNRNIQSNQGRSTDNSPNNNARPVEPQDNNRQSNLSPQALAQNFMQYSQPYQNPYDMYNAYMNPYMNMYGGYGMNPYDPYGQYYPAGHSDKKKKKKKKRRDKSSSEEDGISEKSSDESVDTTPKQKKQSHKSKDKSNDKSKGKSKGKSKDERKAKARSNLKGILWTMVYPHIFSTDTSNKVLDRINAQQQSHAQSMVPLIQNFSTWLMNVTQEGFTALFDDLKKSYDFIGSDFKKVSNSDAVKRATDLKKITKVLLETLFNKTDTFPIEDQYLELLAVVCHKNDYASDETFTNFELMRMNLNSLDRVNGVQMHSQMRIAIILLIRTLAFQLVFKASEWNNKLKVTDQTLINLKIVASLIYRLAILPWEELLPVINVKPSLLDIKPLHPDTMDPLILPPENGSDDPELILGSYTKAQLAPIFNDQDWTLSMKGLIYKWTERMFTKIQEYRQRHPQAPPEKDNKTSGPEKAD